MKDMVALLLVIGVGIYWYEFRSDAEKIEKPVYAVIHTELVNSYPGNISPDKTPLAESISAGSEPIEEIRIIEARDMNECQDEFQNYGKIMAAAGYKESQLTAECKTSLEPDFARLFANQPMHVAYLSFSPSTRNEREARMIFSGVSAAESERLCKTEKSQMEKNHDGTSTCVHAIRG